MIILLPLNCKKKYMETDTHGRKLREKRKGITDENCYIFKLQVMSTLWQEITDKCRIFSCYFDTHFSSKMFYLLQLIKQMQIIRKYNNPSS